MRIDCSKLFHEPRLLLLVWERLDHTVHAEALRLLKDLMSDPRLQSGVMPLLRPAGRYPIDFENPSDPAKLWCGAFKGKEGAL